MVSSPQVVVRGGSKKHWMNDPGGSCYWPESFAAQAEKHTRHNMLYQVPANIRDPGWGDGEGGLRHDLVDGMGKSSAQ